MTRTKRLQPVQHLAANNEQHLARSVAAFERKVAEAEGKLRELERYRVDYQQQFSTRAARGIGATDLRDYQAFLARLTEAIRQQNAVVQRARADRDAEHLSWQHAAKRAKALDHVVEQWRSEERRAGERREQHDSDERAQRRVTRT